MKRSQQILAIAGLALAIWTMAYGFYYAVWIEHQTLDHVGGSLAGAFQHAALRETAASHASLADYARAKYVYTREVDAHSHWIGLAMILMVLAALWNRLSFGERARGLLAGALIAGAFGFPLGVLLQNQSPGALGVIGQLLAVAGSAVLILALGVVAAGFARER
jgi:hypothetical protein